MSGNTIKRLFALLLLAVGLATLAVASPKKQGNGKDPGAAAQNANAEGDKQKGKKVTLSEMQQSTDPSQYVGADTCKTCHEDVAKGYDKGPHWKTTLAKHQGPQWQGCEACHGPGKEHAESADPSKIIRFPSLSAEDASKRCLSCHELGQEHANFLRSAHVKNNVGCNDCHSIHTPKVQAKLLRMSQPQLCYSCHLVVKWLGEVRFNVQVA